MTRLSSSVFAGLVSFALAVPAFASPLTAPDRPSCGDEHEKKGEKKDPAAVPQCGDEHEKKGEKKDPAAVPQCGDEHEKKGEKKDPAAV